MIPSIDLGSDSLGLGGIFQGVANAAGTAECGSKPTCISFGKNSNCAEKTRAYNECLRSSQEIRSKSAAASHSANNTSVLAITVVVALALVTILIFISKR